MVEGCPRHSCPNWHGAMQHNCSLGHTQFCQCDDKHLPDAVYSKATAVPEGQPQEVRIPAPPEHIGEPVVEEVTMRRFQMYQDNRLVATWYEDDNGHVYRPA